MMHYPSSSYARPFPDRHEVTHPFCRFVETLCLSLDLLALQDLTKSLDNADADTVRQQIQQRGKVIEDGKEAAAAAVESEKDAARAAEELANKVEWTEEEMLMLQKAVKKFPPGTPKRWLRCAEFIGGKHTEKSVIAQAKNLAANPSSLNDGKAFERAMKHRNDTLSNKAVEAAQAKAAEVQAKTKAAAQPPAGKRAVVTESVSKPKEGAEKTEPTSAEPVVEWTPEQQKLLEAGLKKYPAADKERWVKIAGDIPGKSKKDCVARYKEIVALLKKKKAEAS